MTILVAHGVGNPLCELSMVPAGEWLVTAQVWEIDGEKPCGCGVVRWRGGEHVWIRGQTLPLTLETDGPVELLAYDLVHAPGIYRGELRMERHD